jgi:predicted nucleic acid-binding Zn ribbon protein
MFCPSCGKEVKEDTKFCSNCGNKVSEVSAQAVSNKMSLGKGKRKTHKGLGILFVVIGLAIALVPFIFLRQPPPNREDIEQMADEQFGRAMVSAHCEEILRETPSCSNYCFSGGTYKNKFTFCCRDLFESPPDCDCRTEAPKAYFPGCGPP